MELNAGTIYEHEEHGEVVVLGIHRVYKSFDTDSREGTLDSVVVRWAANWDLYGALWGHSRSEKLDEFVPKIGDPVDDIEFISPDGK